MIKIYEYKNCDTCRKALKFLDSKKIPYEKISIRDNPPSKAELKKMLGFLDGEIRKLFNTSGKDYKELNMKDQIPKLSEEELLEKLSQNGNLIKRPFVISQDNGLVGFKEEEWQKAEFLK